MKDRGPWTRVSADTIFYLLDPQPEDVHIEDIIRSLSQTCRFSGTSKGFYSNAQHSIYVSKHCREYPMTGLMHDAAETYTGDITRPMQEAMGQAFRLKYKEIEANILKVIAKKFGFESPLPLEVISADNEILRYEIASMENGSLSGFGIELSHHLFRKRFYRLAGGK